MDLVRGDTVLFAGATGRVGGATLATLAREGANVVVLSRSIAHAQTAIDAAVPANERDRVLAREADLADPASAQSAVEFAVEKFGRLDAFVSLAGSGFGFKAFSDSTVDDLRANLDAFVITAYTGCSAALRAMLAQPLREGARSRGRLVVVTAGSSKQPAPGRALFGAAKSAVNTLMLGIAREHKADGIVSNALVLGGVGFAGAEKFYSPEDFAAAATPQEVADILTMLASDRASGINGSLVDLNAREVD